MSINTTPYLHLPQWTADEKPSYLAEINQAYAAIDSGYGNVKNIADTSAATANSAAADAANAKQQANTNAGQIVTIQQTLSQLQNDFINASLLKSFDVTITNVAEGMQIIFDLLAANRYCAYFVFHIHNTTSNTLHIQHGNQIATFAINKFTWKELGMNTNTLSTTVPTSLADATLFANGNLGIYGGVNIGVNGDVYIKATFPVQTISNARDALLPDCVYIKS